MATRVQRLKKYLTLIEQIGETTPESDLSAKPSPERWSKREILGHLVDSGVHNLQRFVEIQFLPKPYRVRKYQQDEWVRVNDYQNAGTAEIMNLLKALNHRIISLIEKQTDHSLEFPVEFEDRNDADLNFLIDDYIDHFEHHVNQLLDPSRWS